MKRFMYAALVVALMMGGMVFGNYNPAMAQPAAAPAPSPATPAPPVAATAPVAHPPLAAPAPGALPSWMPKGTVASFPWFFDPAGKVLIGIQWPDDPSGRLEDMQRAIIAIERWRNKMTAYPLSTQVQGAVVWITASFPFGMPGAVEFNLYFENPYGKGLTSFAQTTMSCAGLTSSQFTLAFHASLLEVIEMARVRQFLPK